MRALLVELVGEDETELLLQGRPQAVLDDLDARAVSAPRPVQQPDPRRARQPLAGTLRRDR